MNVGGGLSRAVAPFTPGKHEHRKTSLHRPDRQSLRMGSQVSTLTCRKLAESFGIPEGAEAEGQIAVLPPLEGVVMAEFVQPPPLANKIIGLMCADFVWYGHGQMDEQRASSTLLSVYLIFTEVRSSIRVDDRLRYSSCAASSSRSSCGPFVALACLVGNIA